jgi:hypothetical protein
MIGVRVQPGRIPHRLYSARVVPKHGAVNRERPLGHPYDDRITSACRGTQLGVQKNSSSWSIFEGNFRC